MTSLPDSAFARMTFREFPQAACVNLGELPIAAVAKGTHLDRDIGLMAGGGAMPGRSRNCTVARGRGHPTDFPRCFAPPRSRRQRRPKLLVEDAALFELAAAHHDHLYCTCCHALVAVPCLIGMTISPERATGVWCASSSDPERPLPDLHLIPEAGEGPVIGSLNLWSRCMRPRGRPVDRVPLRLVHGITPDEHTRPITSATRSALFDQAGNGGRGLIFAGFRSAAGAGERTAYLGLTHWFAFEARDEIIYPVVGPSWSQPAVRDRRCVCRTPFWPPAGRMPPDARAAAGCRQCTALAPAGIDAFGHHLVDAGAGDAVGRNRLAARLYGHGRCACAGRRRGVWVLGGAAAARGDPQHPLTTAARTAVAAARSHCSGCSRWPFPPAEVGIRTPEGAQPRHAGAAVHARRGHRTGSVTSLVTATQAWRRRLDAAGGAAPLKPSAAPPLRHSAALAALFLQVWFTAAHSAWHFDHLVGPVVGHGSALAVAMVTSEDGSPSPGTPAIPDLDHCAIGLGLAAAGHGVLVTPDLLPPPPARADARLEGERRAMAATSLRHLLPPARAPPVIAIPV